VNGLSPRGGGTKRDAGNRGGTREQHGRTNGGPILHRFFSRQTVRRGGGTRERALYGRCSQRGGAFLYQIFSLRGETAKRKRVYTFLRGGGGGGAERDGSTSGTAPRDRVWGNPKTLTSTLSLVSDLPPRERGRNQRVATTSPRHGYMVCLGNGPGVIDRGFRPPMQRQSSEIHPGKGPRAAFPGVSMLIISSCAAVPSRGRGGTDFRKGAEIGASRGGGQGGTDGIRGKRKI